MIELHWMEPDYTAVFQYAAGQLLGVLVLASLWAIWRLVQASNVQVDTEKLHTLTDTLTS
jgi:hypothetical protein